MGTATLENSLRIYHASTIHTSTYTPKRNKNLCSHKILHTNVHSSCVHKSPKLETIQVSFKEWLIINTLVQPHDAIPRSNKKEQMMEGPQLGMVWHMIFWCPGSFEFFLSFPRLAIYIVWYSVKMLAVVASHWLAMWSQRKQHSPAPCC